MKYRVLGDDCVAFPGDLWLEWTWKSDVLNSCGNYYHKRWYFMVIITDRKAVRINHLMSCWIWKLVFIMQVVLGTNKWMWSVSNRKGKTGVLEWKMSDCNLFTTSTTLIVRDSNGSSATTVRRQTAWPCEGGPINVDVIIFYWMFGGLNVLCFGKMWRLLAVTMKNTAFLDLKACILVDFYGYLGQIFCLHLQSIEFSSFLLDR